MGREEDQQVRLSQRFLLRLEEPAEVRDVAKEGDTAHGVGVRLVDQATDRHGLAVVHDDRVLDLAVAEGDADLLGGTDVLRELRDLGDLLEDVQAERVALADLGRDPERDADVLPIDVDRLGEVVTTRRRLGPAGHDRDVVANNDLGLFVVRGEDVGRGHDVDVVVRRGGVDANTPAEAVAARRPAAFRVECVVRVVGKGPDPRRLSEGIGSGYERAGRLQIDVRIAIDDSESGIEAQGQIVGHVDLDDQGFDEHLRPGDVEGFDHLLERFVPLFAGLDHQGVRRRIGRDRDAVVEGRDRGAERLSVRGRPGQGGAAAAAGAAARADQRVERLGELFGVGVLQVVHADSALARDLDVELADEIADVRQLLAGRQHE